MFVFSDSEGTIKNTSFVKMFLMMHPWYISSTDLSKKLLLKYPLSTKPISHTIVLELYISPSLDGYLQPMLD